MATRAFLIGTAALLLQSTAMAAPKAPDYHLVKSVALGAPDRWDYVIYNKDSHRVYVAHGDKLAVVDALSGALIGNVEGIPGGTHGTGIVTQLNKAYTDDGKAGEAVSFDLKTLKITRHIKARDDADGIAF